MRPPMLHLAFADLLEAGDHSKRGRLAAAGRADEHHELAVANLELEIGDSARTVAVALRHVAELDVCHACPLNP